MKIRWKLLLVLTAITLIPLNIMCITSRKTSHDLVESMTATSRQVLVKRAEDDLLRRLKDHATIVGRDGIIVSLALKNQTGRLRQILDGNEKDPSARSGRGLGEKQKHFVVLRDGRRMPLEVDYGRIRIELAPDASVDMAEAERIMRPMLRSFQKVEKANSDLILWQIVRLTNGIIATYPYYEPPIPEKSHAHWMSGDAHHGPRKSPQQPLSMSPAGPGGPADTQPPGWEPPPHEWYMAARHSDRGVYWASPHRDPVTGKFIVGAIGKIQDFTGPFQGAMMIMVPLGSVLEGGLDISELSENMTTLLFRTDRREDGETGLRITAEEVKGVSTSTDRGGWMAGDESKWVETGDPARTEQIIQAIQNRESGSFQLAYQGDDSLWVYAPIHERSGIMLIVPMRNIYGTTVETELYLRAEIESHYTTTTYLTYAMMLVVALLAVLLSKTMTRRLAALSSAFHRLAGGDFSTRVDVRGRDELSELGRNFNALAPALEEQVRMKEALTIAQEVQRSLLPEHPPTVNGLDVAGTSLYCEDTGGDYFDYPHMGIEADEFGLAVGDVSGHGVPAALLMTTARAFLRQRASRGGRLDEVVADANRLLAEDVRLSGRFMTLFLFAVDPETLTARWVRAGHDPAFVYSKPDDAFSELGGDTGLPLGVDGDWDYAEESMKLRPGEIILIGTDGIWEAVNPNGEMFGKERLREIIRISADNSAQDILDTILEALRNFTAEAGFEDDVTLAVVKVNG